MLGRPTSGNDNRRQEADLSYDTTQYPYDTVVFVSVVIGGQAFRGSGVLIGNDEVLTASHVVYDSNYGVASNIVVTPAYNDGYAPYGSATGTVVHYNTISDPGDQISLYDSQYDYAVIHLSNPFTSLGTMGISSNQGSGYANVTGYPASAGSSQTSLNEYIAKYPGYDLYSGLSIGAGSSGGPVWRYGANGAPYVIGVVSSESSSNGYFTQITNDAFDTIASWVQQDSAIPDGGGAPGAGLTVQDTTTGQTVDSVGTAYAGPVQNIQSEYVNITPDSLNVSVTSSNWFIHTGAGTDAIAVSGGRNVLDGGTGSNFLTGGSGEDTYFVDDRGPASDIWSTVNSFGGGDSATVWGVTSSTFALDWQDNQGAGGYTGLTAHFTRAGVPTASLTLVGFTKAALTNGQLSVIYGFDSASSSSYMYVHAA